MAAFGSYDNLAVRNGHISAGFRGIEINQAGGALPVNVVVEDVVVDSFNNTGIYLNAYQSKVRNAVVNEPAGSAATGISAGGVIDSVTIDGPLKYGIVMGNFSNTAVRNSHVTGSAATIQTAASSGSIVNCDLFGGGVLVTTLGNCNVVGNRIDAAQTAISYTPGATGKYCDNVFTRGTDVVGGTNAGNNH